MQKLVFLVFAIFFALTTLAMAHSTRDGPGFAAQAVLLTSEGLSITPLAAAPVPTPLLIATVDPRASPVFAATATSFTKADNRDLQRRVAPGGATHNRTIVSVHPSRW